MNASKIIRITIGIILFVLVKFYLYYYFMEIRNPIVFIESLLLSLAFFLVVLFYLKIVKKDR